MRKRDRDSNGSDTCSKCRLSLEIYTCILCIYARLPHFNQLINCFLFWKFTHHNQITINFHHAVRFIFQTHAQCVFIREHLQWVEKWCLFIKFLCIIIIISCLVESIWFHCWIVFFASTLAAYRMNVNGKKSTRKIQCFMLICTLFALLRFKAAKTFHESNSIGGDGIVCLPNLTLIQLKSPPFFLLQWFFFYPWHLKVLVSWLFAHYQWRSFFFGLHQLLHTVSHKHWIRKNDEKKVAEFSFSYYRLFFFYK